MGSYAYCDCGQGLPHPELSDAEEDLCDGIECTVCGKLTRMLSVTHWVIRLVDEVRVLKEEVTSLRYQLERCEGRMEDSDG